MEIYIRIRVEEKPETGEKKLQNCGCIKTLGTDMNGLEQIGIERENNMLSSDSFRMAGLSLLGKCGSPVTDKVTTLIMRYVYKKRPLI
jgi:hypothetical protein